MQTPRDILTDLWRLAGGEPSALDAVMLTGDEPLLPSSFRVAAAAQVPIAAAGLAAAEIWKLRKGERAASHGRYAPRRRRMPLGAVSAPRRQTAAADCDPTTGIYRTRDARYVRLHTNFAHHRAAVCKVLACEPEREKIQAALMGWDGEAFETAAYAGGAVVSFMRSREEWSATPHAQSARRASGADHREDRRGVAQTLARRRASARRHPRARSLARDRRSRRAAARSRRMAPTCCWSMAPICRRSPGSPSTPAAASSRRSSSSPARRDGQSCANSLAQADIFSQGYRPQAIARHGFSPEEAAKISPGIVYVTLSAYGHAGPWSGRRGFNSLVQTSTGFNHAEGVAAGIEGPKELPAQMLDHASGYLMAFGAMMAKARQAREGGSWHVRVSLAQTGRWLWNLGRVADGNSNPTSSPTPSRRSWKTCRPASVRSAPCAIRRSSQRRPRSGRGRRCRSARTRRNGRQGSASSGPEGARQRKTAPMSPRAPVKA